MTDSSVSQDYLACNNASLCSCDVATLLELLFPLLQTSFRRGGSSSLSLHPIIAQTSSRYSRYLHAGRVGWGMWRCWNKWSESDLRAHLHVDHRTAAQGKWADFAQLRHGSRPRFQIREHLQKIAKVVMCNKCSCL